MNWDPPKISKCGKKFKVQKYRRVQQTSTVCEHTMEQQLLLVQSMPNGVNSKHALLKLVRRFSTHVMAFDFRDSECLSYDGARVHTGLEQISGEEKILMVPHLKFVFHS